MKLKKNGINTNFIIPTIGTALVLGPVVYLIGSLGGLAQTIYELNGNHKSAVIASFGANIASGLVSGLLVPPVYDCISDFANSFAEKEEKIDTTLEVERTTNIEIDI